MNQLHTSPSNKLAAAPLLHWCATLFDTTTAHIYSAVYKAANSQLLSFTSSNKRPCLQTQAIQSLQHKLHCLRWKSCTFAALLHLPSFFFLFLPVMLSTSSFRVSPWPEVPCSGSSSARIPAAAAVQQQTSCCQCIRVACQAAVWHSLLFCAVPYRDRRKA